MKKYIMTLIAAIIAITAKANYNTNYTTSMVTVSAPPQLALTMALEPLQTIITNTAITSDQVWVGNDTFTISSNLSLTSTIQSGRFFNAWYTKASGIFL